MDTTVIIAIVVLVVALVGVALFVYQQRTRSQRLRERFGPEYEHVVEERGDRRSAEQELAAREQRRQRLEIRPLDPVLRDQYIGEWRTVQARFVDQPAEAVVQAHRLVKSVMRDRGYPIDDFEQRAADISVDHPQVIEDYRVAYRITQASLEGPISTEDLREAMVRYRSLFAGLLDIERDEPRHTDTSRGSTL